MKKLKGGTSTPINVCGDPRKDYPWSIYYQGEPIKGECGLINGRCKCITGMGDYQTPDDRYGCQDALPSTIIQP